ncbi:MAG: sugar transferase [Anaerolineales bacterium]|nr:sugar transferase [Anaerolineales bacterium]MCB9432981.1 sugar transferase [Ardenticatenaceae bacterium]
MELRYIETPQVRLYKKEYQLIKRAFDLTICMIALPPLLLLMGVIALLIYMDDPGPVLFKQQRTGKGGKRFGIYKFRTMVTNAEELKVKYMHLNELTWPDFKITNDPRVTKIGNILRKTSLDEIPQIFNVVKGEMSLVGPRPTSFDVSTYSLWHTERLEVTPGITGLWQVKGRSDVDFDDRIALDVEYIENQSLMLDIKILFWTVASVFKQEGAY